MAVPGSQVLLFSRCSKRSPSRENLADHPLRTLCLADSKLDQHLSFPLQNHPSFRGLAGHSVDFIALDLNVPADCQGHLLPHFTPYPTPFSSGVDVFGQDFSQSVSNLLLRNPYIFWTILFIGQVLNRLHTTHLSCTVVVPDVHPRWY